MKVSTKILLVTLIFLLVAMVASNILLKDEYARIDKSNIYWNYERVLDKPFHHLHVQDGNLTNLAYEQSKNYSLRIFKNWQGLEDKRVIGEVKNDTLFVRLRQTAVDQYEKDYMRRVTLIRVFSPQLLSVTGVNSNIQMLKSRERNLHIDLTGRSNLDVESYLHDFDSVHISQADSSRVVFRVSADLKFSDQLPGTAQANKAAPDAGSVTFKQDDRNPSHSWERLNFSYVDANIRGVSILDLGHGYIKEMKLLVADTSAVILSGSGLRRYSSLISR